MMELLTNPPDVCCFVNTSDTKTSCYKCRTYLATNQFLIQILTLPEKNTLKDVSHWDRPVLVKAKATVAFQRTNQSSPCESVSVAAVGLAF